MKLLLTVASTGALWVHLKPIGLMARAATETAMSAGDLCGVRFQLVVA